MFTFIALFFPFYVIRSKTTRTLLLKVVQRKSPLHRLKCEWINFKRHHKGTVVIVREFILTSPMEWITWLSLNRSLKVKVLFGFRRMSEEKVLPWFWTATRFLVIIANRTLKEKHTLSYDSWKNGHRSWALCDRNQKNQKQNNKWNLTAAPSPKSCPLLTPAPVHLGSSARCAAASGRTAASSWCTDPGRTSPAGRRQRCLVKGNATSCCTLKLKANASC